VVWAEMILAFVGGALLFSAIIRRSFGHPDSSLAGVLVHVTFLNGIKLDLQGPLVFFRWGEGLADFAWKRVAAQAVHSACTGMSPSHFVTR